MTNIFSYFNRNRSATELFDRMSGQVRSFNPRRGFGFITPSDNTPEIFVHYQDIASEGFKSLLNGEQVEYDVVMDPNNRRRAVKVTGPGGAPVQGSAPRYNNNNGYNNGGNGGYNNGNFYSNGGYSPQPGGYQPAPQQYNNGGYNPNGGYQRNSGGYQPRNNFQRGGYTNNRNGGGGSFGGNRKQGGGYNNAPQQQEPDQQFDMDFSTNEAMDYGGPEQQFDPNFDQ